MPPVKLILAIHSHQPVGNFGHVFAQAYDRCYRPFLDELARHPQIKVALHYTGPLLEWALGEQPSLLRDVAELAKRGQVEIMGGGFYEPMLAVLSDADAAGQIDLMKDFCEEQLGQTPVGMWLAERVWDPDLPRVIAPTGMRYTLLDDAHFFAAGLPDQRLFGYYVTEKAGFPLAVFPIDKGLRYHVPFKPVSDLIQYLQSAGGPEERVLTYGDDGEKFGLWPGTYGWVYEKGWLRELFTALTDRQDVVQTLHPKEALNAPSSGRVYLPTASYEEMMEWAMPPLSIKRYEEMKRWLTEQGRWEKYRPFIRGGIWQAFFSKYPEANSIHKKMLRVSRKLQEAVAARGEPSEELLEAQTDLYRGQCNCAYWHGLFGGLYLNYLRHALYENLIRAENAVDAELRGEGDFLEYEEVDFDADLRDEALMSNARLCAYVDPDEGGSLFELDYRPKAFCLSNVLSRREESYHEKLRALEQGAGEGHGAGAPRSIHDQAQAKESNLSRHLVVDGYRRNSFIDRFHDPALTLETLKAGGDGDVGDFAGAPYRLEKSGVDEEGNPVASITLVREGQVRRGDRTVPVTVTKTYLLPIDSAQLTVEYMVRNRSQEPLETIFAPELNLTLLAGDDEKRYYELSNGTRARLTLRGGARETEELRLVDAHYKLKVVLKLDRPGELWCYPVETVSQSEAGFERTFQGSCLVLRRPLTLAPGAEEKLRVSIEVEDFEPGPEDRAV